MSGSGSCSERDLSLFLAPGARPKSRCRCCPMRLLRTASERVLISFWYLVSEKSMQDIGAAAFLKKTCRFFGREFCVKKKRTIEHKSGILLINGQVKRIIHARWTKRPGEIAVGEEHVSSSLFLAVNMKQALYSLFSSAQIGSVLAAAAGCFHDVWIRKAGSLTSGPVSPPVDSEARKRARRGAFTSTRTNDFRRPLQNNARRMERAAAVRIKHAITQRAAYLAVDSWRLQPENFHLPIFFSSHFVILAGWPSFKNL